MNRKLSSRVLKAAINAEGIHFTTGTVPVSDEVGWSLQHVLGHGGPFAHYPYHAVSHIRDAGDWLFVSVVGLNKLDAEVGWHLHDAGWFGLVLLQHKEDGSWKGAVDTFDQPPIHVHGKVHCS